MLEPKARSPSYLPVDQLEVNQAKNWTEKVLQAAMMDSSRQSSLLTAAHLLNPTLSAMHCSGCGVALNTSWLWAGLTAQQDQKRRALCTEWMNMIHQEKQKHKESKATRWLKPGLQKSLLMKEGWRAQLDEIRSWLDALADDQVLLP